MEFKLYIGKVISLNDPDESNKIQIKLLPEFKDIADSDCPWLPSFMSNGNSNNPPNVDELVWVLYDQFFQEGYYIPGYYVSGLIDYSDISSILSGNADTGTNNYQDLRFTLFPDDSLMYVNISTGEKGIINSQGSHVIFQSNGDIALKANSQVKLYNGTTNLKDILTDIQEVLQNVITPLNFLDSRGSPCTYTLVSTDLPKITNVLTSINSLLKD